jgi:hypothetical protein
MKAKIISKSNFATMLFSMFILSFFVATEAHAYYKHGPYVPVAICSTSGTSVPLPYYVCCKKLDDDGISWRNRWVPVSCKYADEDATYSMGCKTTSPVYGTGSPINADCQFSFSTGKV